MCVCVCVCVCACVRVCVCVCVCARACFAVKALVFNKGYLYSVSKHTFTCSFYCQRREDRKVIKKLH